MRWSSDWAIHGLLSILAIFGLIYIGSDVLPRASSSRWPTTTGKVTYSDVSTIVDSNGTRYEPVISFEYTVGGVQYTGKAQGDDFPDFENSGAAHRYLQPYQVGQAVTVYYDPSRPSLPVIVPGIHSWGLLIFELLIFSGTIVVFVWRVFRWMRQRRAKAEAGRV